MQAMKGAARLRDTGAAAAAQQAESWRKLSMLVGGWDCRFQSPGDRSRDAGGWRWRRAAARGTRRRYHEDQEHVAWMQGLALASRCSDVLPKLLSAVGAARG